MDYEVFLVSQIAAHHAAGESPRQAVRSGLAASAKVIAAAATIMIAVFGSFILNADPTVKQFGVGLSVAVLLAGTLTLFLAPALPGPVRPRALPSAPPARQGPPAHPPRGRAPPERPPPRPAPPPPRAPPLSPPSRGSPAAPVPRCPPPTPGREHTASSRTRRE